MHNCFTLFEDKVLIGIHVVCIFRCNDNISHTSWVSIYSTLGWMVLISLVISLVENKYWSYFPVHRLCLKSVVWDFLLSSFSRDLYNFFSSYLVKLPNVYMILALGFGLDHIISFKLKAMQRCGFFFYMY